MSSIGYFGLILIQYLVTLSASKYMHMNMLSLCIYYDLYGCDEEVDDDDDDDDVGIAQGLDAEV